MMKKHTVCLNLRYSQAIRICSGILMIGSFLIWFYYWFTQSKILFPDGLMILLFAALPGLLFLYLYHWRVTVTDREFIIRRLFRKSKRYSWGQVEKVVAFSSYAEKGPVIWIRFTGGTWLKISHSLQNYDGFHRFLLQKRTIEWR